MTSPPTIVRAAVVQAAPIAFQRERTVEKVRTLTNDAARQGAQLVVFPEAFLSAYPCGLSFGAVVGSRTPEGREDYRRYWESAVDVPGPTVDTLAEIAAQNQVYLVMGVIERMVGRSTVPSCSSRQMVSTWANIASSCPPPLNASSGASAMARRCPSLRLTSDGWVR